MIVCSLVDAYPGLLDNDGPTHVGMVLLGQKLIWHIYNSINNSSYKENTLLIITYDEHSGCFDHVAPPSPLKLNGNETKGQNDFNCNRLGLRVLMVMFSAYLHKNTIINHSFKHSSFIKTMCKRW